MLHALFDSHRLTYPLLEQWPGVCAASFSRLGGVSTGPYQALNLSFDVGDCRENVLENSARVEKIIGRKVKILTQVHSTTCIRVDRIEDRLPPCDGMVTNSTEFAIGILHADCQAAVLFDPQKKVIGAIHAGWRGLAGGIYKQAVNLMVAEYGCSVSDIRVAISPSLGPCHAEFVDWEKIFPNDFFPFLRDNNHFDLWAIARAQLEQLGILPGHIHIEPKCTYCSSNLYFSYRREKVTGRNLTLIFLTTTP